MTGVSATRHSRPSSSESIGVIMIVIGGRAIISGAMTLGDFVHVHLVLTGLMAAPVVQIASIGTQISEAFAGLDRIRELLEMATEDEEDSDEDAARAIDGEVVFEDVTFEYNADVPVLKDVSFRAPAGTTTALVGLERLGQEHAHQPGHGLQPAAAGRILIDGRDLTTVRLRDYRSRSASCSRTTSCSTAPSARTSVTASRCDARGDRAVSRIAHADEFIDGFEKGYDTIVGERGVKLSADNASASRSRARFWRIRASWSSTRRRRASTARARH